MVAKQHKPIHRRVALKLIKAGMDTKQVIENFLRSDKLALAKSYPFSRKKGSARRQYFTGLNNQ